MESPSLARKRSLRPLLLFVGLAVFTSNAVAVDKPFRYRCHFAGGQSEVTFYVDEGRGLVNELPASFSPDVIRLEQKADDVTATILFDRKTNEVKSLARPFDIVVSSGTCTRTDRPDT